MIMGNPFFNQFGNQNLQSNSPFGNMQNMMSQFQQFKNGFHGDARQEVQNLLTSGRMTQQQFNQLSQLANTFKSFLK